MNTMIKIPSLVDEAKHPFHTTTYSCRGSSQVTASPPNQDNVTLAPIFVLDGNLIPGSWCECRQTTSNEDCMCHGAGLLEIPSNLSTTLKTL
ncbi:hypothetical protein M8J76_007126 [Diaphorina citri]|nr:hypothetical protein M8J76_007126 [Diaphorina citri]